MNIKSKVLIVLLAALLLGCNQKIAPSKHDVAQIRQEDAAALAAPPAVRQYPVGTHQLLVVKVPVMSNYILSYQTCFVWRDSEYKSASLQCGNDAGVEWTTEND